jgi:hypothetical protein
VWDIPAVRMKTVRGDSLPHLVPLSRQALALLEGLREVGEGAERMFPGAVNPTRPMSENTMLYGLYALGYKNLMTGHGFRTLASTILNKNKRKINISTEAIEAQLSHVKRDKVAATYDKWNYIDERREFMQWWSDYVDAALKEGREQPGPSSRVYGCSGPVATPRQSPFDREARTRSSHQRMTSFLTRAARLARVLRPASRLYSPHARAHALPVQHHFGTARNKHCRSRATWAVVLC